MNRDQIRYRIAGIHAGYPVATLPALKPGCVLYIDTDDSLYLYDPHVCWWSRQVMALWFAVPYLNALVWALWLQTRRGQRRALFEIGEAA